jgi:hypothetical protein
MSPVAGIPGYGTVWTIGHPRIRDLLVGEVVVQEKLDGWQFAARVTGGRLRCRSKEAEIDTGNPPPQYAPAVSSLRAALDAGLLDEGFIYRGEAMAQARAHRLPYSRPPRGGLVLWDVIKADGTHGDTLFTMLTASGLNVEATKSIYLGEGGAVTQDMLLGWLERESFLGGPRIEGVVIKNYDRGLVGKFVTHRFREVLQPDGKGDVIDQLIRAHRTGARREKAAQRLEARGALKYDHGDFAPLRDEVIADILEECTDTILEALPAENRNDNTVRRIAEAAAEGMKQWWGRELIRRQVR